MLGWSADVASAPTKCGATCWPGKSGIGRVTHFDVSAFDCQIAGEVKNFDPLNWVEKKELKKMARFIQIALAASDFGMKMAGLQVTPEIADATGVYIASGIGGFDVIEREHSKYLHGGPGKISPFFIPAAIINLASGHVSIRYGAKGPNSATATACSASAHAIGDAYKIIQRCAAEVMIAGGSEAAVTPMGIGGFAAMRALSTRNDEPERASRPFDAQRDGFVVGEGAGVLILESLEFAQRRGANIIARNRRLRNVGRRVPHHAAGRRRRRRLSRFHGGAEGCENFAGRHRLRERARHVDADRRRHRNRRRSSTCSASARRKCPSARPSR